MSSNDGWPEEPYNNEWDLEALGRMTKYDPYDNTDSRPVVLFLHGCHDDIRRMGKHGVDMFGAFTKVVDTQHLAKKLSRLYKDEECRAGQHNSSCAYCAYHIKEDVLHRCPNCRPEMWYWGDGSPGTIGQIMKHPVIGDDCDPQSRKLMCQTGREDHPIGLKRLIWALNQVFPTGYWHNAGNDAHITLVCAVDMMKRLASFSNTDWKKDSPVFVAIDFEGGWSQKTGPVTTEIGLSILDTKNLADEDKIDKSIKTFHTLFEGLEHIHPRESTERQMGIWYEGPHGPRPRWSFAYGPHGLKLKRSIEGASKGTTIDVPIDTEIIRQTTFKTWITSKLPRAYHEPPPPTDNEIQAAINSWSQASPSIAPQ